MIDHNFLIDGHRIEVVDVNDTTANPTAEENGDKWEKVNGLYDTHLILSLRHFFRFFFQLTSNLERNAEAIEEVSVTCRKNNLC